MSTATVIGLLGVAATLALALVGAVVAYGRNVQSVTTLTDEVKELRKTCANVLERVGRIEGKMEGVTDVVRDYSGRVRGDRG